MIWWGLRIYKEKLAAMLAARSAARPPTLSGLHLIRMQQNYYELPSFFCNVARTHGPIVRFSPVGTGIAARPPVRSEHARFAHSAPLLGI